MAAEFWIRRTPAGDFTIDDLGLTVEGSGDEIDLLTMFDTEQIVNSADLAAAIVADDVTRIDGPAGSPIAAADAFKDIQPQLPLTGNEHQFLNGKGEYSAPVSFIMAKNMRFGWNDQYEYDLTFTDGTRQLDITPTGASFTWYQGIWEYQKTSDSIIISTAEGLHMVFYNGNTLTETVNPTGDQIASVLRDNTLVAFIYWDATNSKAIYLGYESHSFVMPPETHINLHLTRGAQYISGNGATNVVADGNGDLDVHAQFGISSGRMADEDVYTDSAGVGSTTGLPIYHLEGSEASPNIRQVINSGFSVRTTGSGRLAYNLLSGGSWSVAEVTNNNFVLCHVLASNDSVESRKLIAFMGQAQYANIAAARAAAEEEINRLVLGRWASQEMVKLFTFIFQTADGYANSVKGRIRTTDTGADYIDWRGTSAFAAAGDAAGTTFSDNDFGLFNDADPTKQADFDLSGISSGYKRTVTLPDKNIEVDDKNDSRPPTSHASTHQSGGADSIKLDDLAAPDDNTDLDATTGQHGLLPKLGGGTANFLRADGTWATPSGGTPGAHASTHENGGSDEISVAGLSGALADPQTPSSHASTHDAGGADAMAIDAAAGTGSLRTLGTGSQQACAGDDARLSDDRNDPDAIHDNVASEIYPITEKGTPVTTDVLLIEDAADSYNKKKIRIGSLPAAQPAAHHTSHESGGSDSIKLDDLATPDDNTDLDATTGQHGLLPKLGGGTANFLRADGTWAAPDGGTPASHASSHENGGSDEISVAGLSGALADPQTPESHASSHENGGADEMSVAGLSGALADPQTPSSHASTHQSGGADSIKLDDLAAPDDNTDLDATTGQHGLLPKLGGGTANFLRADGSWASPDGGTPAAHASTHENGGADEMSVAGLSGALADPQTPSSHASTHENGGADEMSVAGLSGALADPQTPSSHASSHQSGGADSIKLDDLATPDDNTDLDATTGQHGLLPKLGGGTTNFLRADGTWAAPPGGTPDPHASTHENGGSDEISVAGLSGTLADPQTPSSHASTHQSGGADAIKLDDLAAPDDNTDLNATTGQHGLLPKLGGGTSNFLRADGSWASPDGGTPAYHASSHQSGGGDSIKLDDLATPDDNTDLNATTSQHGLLPKLGGGTTNFLRADGTWAAPGASSSFPTKYYDADMLDLPLSSDWAVTDNAALAADSNNSALSVLNFDDTDEEGCGLLVQPPSGATNIVITIRSRADTAPGGTSGVALLLYKRDLPDNSAVGSWSGGYQMTDLSFPTNEYWQYDSQTIALSTLGITAGRLTQLELVRDTIDGGDTLSGDWVLSRLQIGWT